MKNLLFFFYCRERGKRNAQKSLTTIFHGGKVKMVKLLGTTTPSVTSTLTMKTKKTTTTTAETSVPMANPNSFPRLKN